MRKKREAEENKKKYRLRKRVLDVLSNAGKILGCDDPIAPDKAPPAAVP